MHCGIITEVVLFYNRDPRQDTTALQIRFPFVFCQKRSFTSIEALNGHSVQDAVFLQKHSTLIFAVCLQLLVEIRCASGVGNSEAGLNTDFISYCSGLRCVRRKLCQGRSENRTQTIVSASWAG